MSNAPIGDELRRYILTSVPSVPFMEALLIFRDSSEPRTIEWVARHLYIGTPAAVLVVEQLDAALIIEAVGAGSGYRYAPAPELAPVLDQLVAAYRAHLVEVTALIHSRTGRMAQHFADAFRLRKD